MLAAVDEGGVMGLRGGLPWRNPEDLAFFSSFTQGRRVLMGRSTFEGLPTALPGRSLLVLTRDPFWTHQGVERVSSVEEALKALAGDGVIAGGAQVYRMFFPHAHEVLLSRIPGRHEGDTFFPEVPSSWRLVDTTPRTTFTLERYAPR